MNGTLLFHGITNEWNYNYYYYSLTEVQGSALPLPHVRHISSAILEAESSSHQAPSLPVLCTWNSPVSRTARKHVFSF